MLVYRDALRTVSGSELRRELVARIARSEANPAALPRAARKGCLALSLLAGELETALEDLGELAQPATLATARAFTEACAEAWWRGNAWDRSSWELRVAGLALPDSLSLKRPEGYAYYALDPAAYACAAAALAPSSGRVLVVGIRSIGTSLSAFAGAALRERGLAVERFSVRPHGHPWDRRCAFDASELERAGAFAGPCIVVDEGPGLSGSTFLAAGEGLERAGVARERITFITSHAVAVERLVARDAPGRWSRFRARAAPETPPFFDGALDLGAGRWRERVFASELDWPSSWTSAERRKFEAPNAAGLLKFVGLPPYGEAPLTRAERLADAGFSPRVVPDRGGYSRQSWCPGEVLTRRALPASLGRLLPRVVEYLAFRSEACAAPEGDTRALAEMARCNVAEALGAELPAGYRLEVARWVHPDARLAPHEWVACADTWLKVDASDHGDDHFFPGACDSAWDLGGAIVELELDEAGARELLERYRRRTGDDARRRILPYLVAYAAQRVGALTLALASADSSERPRIERDLGRYRDRLARLVARQRRSIHRSVQ